MGRPKDVDGQRDPLLVVLGPNASGKTRMGVRLALEFGGEILSADSRQVYRGLDIGAGKDLEEYEVGGVRIPCHLIDVADLSEEFNVFRFLKEFHGALQGIVDRGALPVLVGGTGLYLESVLLGYSMGEAPENEALRTELQTASLEELGELLRSLRPDLHNTTDLLERERVVRAIEIAKHDAGGESVPRPSIEALVLGIRRPRPILRERIGIRLKERLEGGMIEEVQGLLKNGVSSEKLHFLGLEYRFVADFLEGRIRNRNDLYQKLRNAIVKFAKRQETWFRRMEKRGIEIHWIEGGDIDEAMHAVRRWDALHPGPS
jgi:tRNA dimethylallyltransferase